MKPRLSRTSAAVMLTVAAVSAPCAAWYFAGARGAEQESRRILDEPRDAAKQVAERLAARLAARLETLRAAETRRPMEHYESTHGTAAQPCDCASPLAPGLADPLARAHFQIDDVGRLTLPTLVGTQTPSPDPAWTRDQQAVLEQLECAEMATLPAAVDPERDGVEPAARPDESETIILVGPLRWHTLSLDGLPSLVAIREVSTPGAVLTQGFVVSDEAVQELLGGAPFPARLAPGPSDGETAATLPLEGVQWHVAVDAEAALDEAAVAADGVRQRFRRTFLAGTAAAMLAGLCVVGLVWQTERLARQRSDFAAAAAHELRTPLAGLRMYGEMLAEELGDASRRREYSRRIADESARLGRVVDNVLGFSRFEREPTSLRCETGDLSAAVADATERLRPALEREGARVELSLASDMPAVRFDRDAVAQIVHNLLDNAEKYSRRAADRTLHVELNHEPGGIELAVRDHGPGLPTAARRHLGKPFDRPQAAGDPPGLGLGLAVVNALARAHGGTLRYRSAAGGGARLSVSFPSVARSPASR